jgi:hypothetical protein
VSSLEEYPSADRALAQLVPADERRTYERALARLAAAEVIDAR